LSGCGGGSSSVPNTTTPARSQTFANPLLKQSAADPWIIRHNGYYLFTFTTARDIQIWKSPTLEGIGNARKVTVWRAPVSGPNSRDIWAPEIHFLRGKWYIYYTATNGPDANRRLFVLEAKTDDPQGAYLQKAKLTVPGAGQDQCSLDGDVFQQGDALYLLWSGRENTSNLTQNIYIAPMSDPWTISGARVAISTPQYDWERRGGGRERSATSPATQRANLCHLLGQRWQHAQLLFGNGVQPGRRFAERRLVAKVGDAGF